MDKAELLELLDDPEVRAKLLEHVDPVRLKADVVQAVREDAAADVLQAVREDAKSNKLGVIIDQRVKASRPGWLAKEPHER